MNEELKDILESAVIEEFDAKQLGTNIGNFARKARDKAVDFKNGLTNGYKDNGRFGEYENEIKEIEQKYAQQAINELNKQLSSIIHNNQQTAQPEQQQPIEQ